MAALDWGQVISSGTQFANQLIGDMPRGESTEFLTRIYPIMLNQARQTNLPTEAFWFGDIVRVNPDGRFGAIQSQVGSVQNAYDVWAQKGRTDSFYVLDCGAGPETGACRFIRYGPGAPSPSQQGASTVAGGTLGTGGTTGLLILGALVVGGYFLIRRF